MEQQTRYRIAAKAGYSRLGYDEISAEQDHGSTSIGSLHFCEREKVNNDRDSSEAGKSTGIRTQAKRER